MHKMTMLAASVLGLVAVLGGCKPGQGNRDTLTDGATDRASGADSAAAGQSVGPPTAPVTSAGPGAGNPVSMPGATTSGATLVLAQGSPRGAYLSNAAGNALYFVEGDTDGSKCTGDCVGSWPPVVSTGVQPSGGPGLEGAKIATITRADGSVQVAFDGRPLYRYAADSGAGTTNGDGVKDKFGRWHLATPSSGKAAMPPAP